MVKTKILFLKLITKYEKEENVFSIEEFCLLGPKAFPQCSHGVQGSGEVMQAAVFF
jgi:hypothetical protein